MKLYFNTPNKLEIAALTTFGISAKDTTSPIGFFGTGFKYALAVILRGGGAVNVRSDDGIYTFTSKPTTVRDQVFNVIYMNDQPLGFTTYVGKTWEPWMALRELISNTRDEGGTVTTVPDDSSPTVIEVHSPALYSAYLDRDRYFLPKSSKPLFKTDTLEVHTRDPVTQDNIFYRGIAVGQLSQWRGLYTYNLTGTVDLTEDRTMKYTSIVMMTLVRQLCKLTDRRMIERLLLAPDDSLEAHLPFYVLKPRPSDDFIDVAAELYGARAPIHSNIVQWIRPFLDERNISQHAVEITPDYAKMLTKAVELTNSLMGHNCAVPIEVVPSLDGAFGKAVGSTKIYLSLQAFEFGFETLIATLIEERLHAERNLEDFSRSFQDTTLNLLAKLLLERMHNETQP